MLETDPVDDLIADESQTVLEGARAAKVLLLNAPALVERAREAAEEVVAWCDDLREHRELPADVVADDLAEALTGCDLVWLRLPKGLGALDEYAELVANLALPEVRVVAGGRVKHMTLSMNEVLLAHFGSVNASLGRQKSRVLHARLPYPADDTWPRSKKHADLGVELWAHGATFAGAKLDPGSKLLTDHLKQLGKERTASGGQVRDVLDLGCGNGVLATLLARRFPEATVLASDVSQAAVEATRLTAETNRARVQVLWRDGLTEFDDDSLDLIVTNPPFHIGNAKESGPALEMFADAARVLRPGGELWCVYNSHLPWRARLNELVGQTRVIEQNPKYTLTRTIAR
ncbi:MULTISPECIES: class I SAM-dependent methyltransferase [unclassified Luteococcus]|uniref:class I SAM-dependent methyltransferase n=1 Tax=unclassified Luteococcus TaxID=2639923 RepID=UPI00313EC162